MRLTNTTNIPDDKIRELITFSKPTNVTKFDVMIKNSICKGVRGRAYTQGSSYHYSNAPFIVIAIGTGNYPLKTYDKGAYIPFIVKNKEENLLYVIAHVKYRNATKARSIIDVLCCLGLAIGFGFAEALINSSNHNHLGHCSLENNVACLIGRCVSIHLVFASANLSINGEIWMKTF